MKTTHHHFDINTPNYYAKFQKLPVIWHEVNYITKLNLCNLLFLARNGVILNILFHIKKKTIKTFSVVKQIK